MNQRSDVRDDMYGWIPEKERVLVGVGGQRGDERENQYGMEASLAELAELAQSAGLEVVATLTQRMKHPHSGTYVGKGKMRELRRLCGLPDRTANDDDDDAHHSPGRIIHRRIIHRRRQRRRRRERVRGRLDRPRGGP